MYMEVDQYYYKILLSLIPILMRKVINEFIMIEIESR
jgi:hypothetical protein